MPAAELNAAIITCNEQFCQGGNLVIVHDCIADILSEISSLSDLELFKLLKTNEDTNKLLGIFLTNATTYLMGYGFVSATTRSVLRTPLQIISQRLTTCLEDDAVKRLRVFE